MASKSKGSKGTHASSNRAAAFLANNATSCVPAGFGGFGGLAFGAPLQAQDTDELDPELAQALKGLSKRDSNTKMKAIQSMDTLLDTKSDSDVSDLLPPWIYAFRKLAMDNSRNVRTRSSKLFGKIISKVGRKLAPHLKAVIGVWWLTMSDPDTDASRAAMSAFKVAFPTKAKQQQSIAFARQPLVEYLQKQLFSSAADMGDATKESTEALEERHCRVLSQCVDALHELFVLIPPTLSSQQTQPCDSTPATPLSPAASSPATSNPVDFTKLADNDAAGLQQLLEGVLDTPGFWNRVLKSSVPTISKAAYSLVSHLAQDHSDLLSARLEIVAPLVYGSLKNTHPECHGPMWGMVLQVGARCPEALQQPKTRTLLPQRLHELLRHSCYGSATLSAPALLPLVAQMYRSKVPSWCSAAFTEQTLEAVLDGAIAAQQPQSGAMHAAYSELAVFYLFRLYQHGGLDAIEPVLKKVYGVGIVGSALTAEGGALEPDAARVIIKGIISDVLKLKASKVSECGALSEFVLVHTGSLLVESMQGTGSDNHPNWRLIAATIDSVMSPLEGLGDDLPSQFMEPVLSCLSDLVSCNSSNAEASHLMAHLVSNYGNTTAASAAQQERCLHSGLTLTSVADELITEGSDLGSAQTAGRIAILSSLLKPQQQPATSLCNILLPRCTGEPALSFKTVLSALFTPHSDSKPLSTSIVTVCTRLKAAELPVSWDVVSRCAALMCVLFKGDVLLNAESTEGAATSSTATMLLLCLANVLQTGCQCSANVVASVVHMACETGQQQPAMVACVPDCICDVVIVAVNSAHVAAASICALPSFDSLSHTQASVLSHIAQIAQLLLPAIIPIVTMPATSFTADRAAAIAAVFTLAVPVLAAHAPRTATLTGELTRLTTNDDDSSTLFAPLEQSAATIWTSNCVPGVKQNPLDDASTTRVSALLADAVTNWHYDTRRNSPCTGSPEDIALAACTLSASSAQAASHAFDLLLARPTSNAATLYTSLFIPSGKCDWANWVDIMPTHPDIDHTSTSSLPIQERDASPASDCLRLVRACSIFLNMPLAALPQCPSCFAPAFIVEAALHPYKPFSQALVHLLLEHISHLPDHGAAALETALSTLWRLAQGPSKCDVARSAVLSLLDQMTGSSAQDACAHLFMNAIASCLPQREGGHAGSTYSIADLSFIVEACRRISTVLTDYTGSKLDALMACEDAFAAAWLTHIQRSAPIVSVPLGDSAHDTVTQIALAMSLASCCLTASHQECSASLADTVSDESALLMHTLHIPGSSYHKDGTSDHDKSESEHSGKDDTAGAASTPITLRASPLSPTSCSLLASVVRHQLSRLRGTAAAAQMANQVYTIQPSHQSALAELCLCALLVIPDTLTSDDVTQAARFVTAYLADTAQALEERVETVSESVVELATAVPSAPEHMSAEFAYNFIARLPAGKHLLPEHELSVFREQLRDACAPVVHLQSVFILHLLHELHRHLRESPVMMELMEEADRLLTRVLLCYGSLLHSVEVTETKMQGDGTARALCWGHAAGIIGALASESVLGTAVEEFDAWTEDIGVTSFAASFALLTQGEEMSPVRGAGLRLCTLPSLLLRATFAPAMDEAQEESVDEIQERSGGNTEKFLIAIGAQPCLVQGLHRPSTDALSQIQGNDNAVQVSLLAWAILFAHLGALNPGSAGRQRIALTLGTCNQLLSDFLNEVVSHLPIQVYLHTKNRAPRSPLPQRPCHPESWSLRTHLQSAALDISTTQATGSKTLDLDDPVGYISVGLFRAALQIVPASVRGWFCELRDRRIQSAVEEYTTAVESPLALQQEVQGAVQVQKTHNSDDLVITASESARQVVAAIEVDDGASLELAIKMPACFPLKAAEVNLRRKVAVPDKKL